MRRATVKIERAVGDADTGGISVDLSREEETATATVQQALASGRALRIRYYTAGRDAVSQRTVDPMRLLLVGGRGYLEAWCRRAEGVRLFRLDRVEDVMSSTSPRPRRPTREPTDLSAGLFQPAPEHRRAVLVLEPEAHWVAEYYPVDDDRRRAGERRDPGRHALRRPGVARAAGAGAGRAVRGWSSHPSSPRRWRGGRRQRWP